MFITDHINNGPY